MSEKTLSDFMDMPVQRTGDVAEIIFDHVEHEGKLKPVRLIGFTENANKSDFEIREAALAYYKALFQSLDNSLMP